MAVFLLVMVICIVVTPIVCFLLGSIPWGVIISRVFYHTDIREHGSGNIGTTNAARTLGTVGGIAVFILDFLKGLLAGLIGVVLGIVANFGGGPALGNEVPATFLFGLITGLAFLACVCGHVYSPWLHFKGGKGIACAVACAVFVFGWPYALMEFGLFVVLVLVTRYISIGSIAAAVVCPFVAWWCSGGSWIFVLLSTLTALVIIWAHRGNIKRLRDGTEPRLFSKKKGEKA
jgi:glycerol-3-phosphate acyltransferase PlsY